VLVGTVAGIGHSITGCPALLVHGQPVKGCPTVLAPALLAVVVAAAWVAWWRRLPRTGSILTGAGFCLAAAALAAGARDEALHPPLRAVLDTAVGGFLIDGFGPENDHDPFPVRLELLEDAAIRDDYVSLRARVLAVKPGRAWNAAQGDVTFTVSGEASFQRAREWRAGRVLAADATFRRPSRYLNDGVPDFERQLALDGTTLFGSIKSGLLIDVLTPGSWFEEWTADVRAHVRAAVGRWVDGRLEGRPLPTPDPAAAIVTAVLIGDRTGLSVELTDRLQRAGTYHVIAISGGNIAVLAALSLALLSIVGAPARARALVTIAVLLVYAQIAAAGPSVWRATVMAIVYLSARLLDHRTPPWQAITLAAAAMALAAPLDVRGAGFVLTFGATGALLEGATRLRGVWSRLPRGAAWVLAPIAASIAVELVLMPVSAQSFSRVTIAGPLLNLVAVPLMAVAQVAGLVLVFADRWPFVAWPAGWIAGLAASGIVESARFVDVAPALSWRVPPPGIAALAVYYGSLLTILIVKSRRLRLVMIAVPIAALPWVIGIVPRPEAATVPGLRLTMIDVGQGEAMVLESGTSRLQVDTGGAPFGAGSFDIGARVVAPALWARKVGRLDAVLLTHGDPDHAGGAGVLLDSFAPRRLWEGIVVPAHEPSRRLRAQAESDRIAAEVLRAGQSFRWGSALVRVLHPAEPDWERPRVRNDDSVVLEVTCGSVALLLTGDISSEVEREIAPQLTPAATRVLKVGHHGSRTSTSSALLERWQPQIALISAGRGNTFGHPTPEVIGRLEAIGAEIYRTDRDGQITLESDCKHVSVATFTGKTLEPRSTRRRERRAPN
jgi:competence protein ComEC